MENMKRMRRGGYNYVRLRCACEWEAYSDTVDARQVPERNPQIDRPQASAKLLVRIATNPECLAVMNKRQM